MKQALSSLAVLVAGLLASFPAGSAHALVATSFPITLPSVASAVLGAHPELAGDTFELPARIESHQPEPVLQASALQTWPASIGTQGSLGRIRIHCQSSVICLPFYVLVHVPTPFAIAGSPIASDSSAASVARAGVQAALPLQTPASARVTSAPHALRHGGHAHLLIDSGLLHLRIPVVCLQDGDPGSLIRVQSVDRHVTYQATVVDPLTVRGTL